MSYSTFTISELSDEADDDFAVEVQTSDSRMGILVSEQELEAMGRSMLDSVDGDMDKWDGASAQEIAKDD